jgi:methionine--tRNA ligase beta chain
VDLGTEERTLVAGLKPYYKPEEMEGKLIVVVANLAPAKLRGVESRGMLLAAEDDEGHVVFLSPERDIKPGSKIH